MAFPARRLRRLRRTPALRRMVAEARITVDDLVAPLFVREDITSPAPVPSLAGVVQHTRESLRKEVRELAGLGVPAVVLFGIHARKDAPGSEAWNRTGIVQAALDGAGQADVAILAYAARYALALYGPFRDAVDVTIRGGGDRKGYQQDWHNKREALAEIAIDIDEGADMVMVKPALAYLDVI